MKKHANPVELILKKDIYIITNDINNKVYIGQAINSENRFKSHCKKNNDKILIDRAIQKYGKCHFTFSVLEHQIENYNEREEYWIRHYNSIVPNGYNIMQGGNLPPRKIGAEHPNSTVSEATIGNVKNDLKTTSLSLGRIAKKWKVSKRTVLRINQGNTWYYDKNESYPLRKAVNINGKLTENDVSEIITLLKTTYLLDGEIAKKFNVQVHAISDINAGVAHHRDCETYPIRNWKSSGKILFSYEDVTNIIFKLQNTNISMNKLAKEYNVGVCSIITINDGSAKKYRRENIQYPIRKNRKSK